MRGKLSSVFRCAAKATSSKPQPIITRHVAPTSSIKPNPSEDSADILTQEISALIGGDISSSTVGLAEGSPQSSLVVPWSQNLSRNCIMRRKERSRERKHRFVFKGTFDRRFECLVKTCAEKLGSDVTLRAFGKLGRETGIKEYNAFIGLCVEQSKAAVDEEVISEQISKVHQLFMLMREQGLPLEEKTYGQFLSFLIDMERVEDFRFFCGVIRQENSKSLPRLSYYEMLLCVRLDEDKIKELCDHVATNDDAADNSGIRENYFLALCESDRSKELLMLLDIIDITKISSMDHLESVFRSLGKLLLESFAKKFIVALNSNNIGAENISTLIYNYALNVPNLAVQEAFSKFKSLHEELEMKPASASYTKLIEHCCTLLKVHTALDIIDYMLEVSLTPSLETVQKLLQTCEKSCEFNLVQRIYSVIRHCNLRPKTDTFRIMISLSVKMKDFEGAYNMIKDMEKFNVEPNAMVYNTIMAAHFREKNFHAGLHVLKEMEQAHIAPDSHTLSYLIGNCDREEDITKYYEKAKRDSSLTKHVVMALINAYATCGLFEKAKQVVLKENIHVDDLNDVKNVLVSALASHGAVSDALSIYEEIKEAKCRADPRTVLCLIENLRSTERLNNSLDLLEDMKNNTDYWIEGCFRIVAYCVECKDLRSTIKLLKQLKDKFCDDDTASEVLFDEAFCKIAEMEHVDLKYGLDLLHSIKKELGVLPSRKSLDFLLYACIRAKDSKTALLIWKEYTAAGLDYNGLAYLRMYQVLLACDDPVSARKMQKKIPLDDPHIRCVVKACQETYDKPKKKKKKKEKSILLEDN